MRMVEYLKANGKVINDMGKVMKDLPMAISIRASTPMVSPMEKVFILGQIQRYMMVNGDKESSMAMGCGEAPKAIVILVNGLRAKHLATVCMSGKIKINTKVSGTRI